MIRLLPVAVAFPITTNPVTKCQGLVSHSLSEYADLSLEVVVGCGHFKNSTADPAGGKKNSCELQPSDEPRLDHTIHVGPLSTTDPQSHSTEQDNMWSEAGDR